VTTAFVNGHFSFRPPFFSRRPANCWQASHTICDGA
jgi:hypothetical protein